MARDRSYTGRHTLSRRILLSYQLMSHTTEVFRRSITNRVHQQSTQVPQPWAPQYDIREHHSFGQQHLRKMVDHRGSASEYWLKRSGPSLGVVLRISSGHHEGTRNCRSGMVCRL